jgi:hypothetical protein
LIRRSQCGGRSRGANHRKAPSMSMGFARPRDPSRSGRGNTRWGAINIVSIRI